MDTNTNERQGFFSKKNPWIWPNLGLVAFGILWVFFYGVIDLVTAGDYQFSVFEWAWRAWNPETNMEHGPLIPVLIAGLIFARRRELLDSLKRPKEITFADSLIGGLAIMAAILCFLLAHRTLQLRIALGAVPILMLGVVCFLYGMRTARHLLYPALLFWLMVPLPSFQQSTVPLQKLATSGANMIAHFFGVESEQIGTSIFAADRSWGPLSITGGCSGIRSLMALVTLAAGYAYLAFEVWWKRGLLILSAVPIAVFCNGLRVASICLIAEYGNKHFATTTWHDWSGLLLFFPVALFLMMFFVRLMDKGLAAFWGRKIVRRSVET